jgi:transcriptional regulator with XRE-family HTH domain
MTELPGSGHGSPQGISQLGARLRAQRRAKRLSLRDLAAQIGVSLNTLSRVERGHIPDLKNFQRIVDWLNVPAEIFLEPPTDAASTPEIIVRHLRSDPRLSSHAVDKIAELVEDMYDQLANEQQTVAIHLRSAKTFTPAASALLSEILSEMRSELLSTWEPR